MSAPLCNAVLNINDSQLILETLEKNNMFVIPLDTRGIGTDIITSSRIY